MSASVREACETVIVGGREFKLAFPDTGNAGHHLRNILAGTDYPAPAREWRFEPAAIVDVGANVGATVFCFRQRYPNVPIFCFEPAAGNIEYLERNVRMSEQVEVFPYGLYETDLDANLYHGNTQCLQHSIIMSPEVNSADAEAVRLRDALPALQDILAPRSILKMETEGCEVEILRRIEPLLHNIDIIYLEYHLEEHRRMIDQILGAYSVLHSSAGFLHRGNMMYISERLIRDHPEIDRWGLRDA